MPLATSANAGKWVQNHVSALAHDGIPWINRNVISRAIKPVSCAAALGEEVKAIAQGLLDEAIAHMRTPQRSGVETAVHETRKRIKVLRALLRLTNWALVDAEGRAVRRGANEALRGAARSLGEARDAAVMLRTLDLIVDAEQGALFAQSLTPLRQELADLHAQGTSHDQQAIPNALGILEQVRAAITSWHMRPGTSEAWEVIDANLRRIYRRARRAMKAAAGTETAEQWHVFRRRGKDLRYSLELLRNAAPELLEPAARVARVMTDHLGDDHDLHVLLEYVRASGAAEEEQKYAIATLIEGRSRGHRVAALREGALLLAERPASFVPRIAAYWCAASTYARQE